LPTKNLAPVVCFLDESATDANDSDLAVMGGFVINRRDIPEFEAGWKRMLKKHRLAALHMVELGTSGPYPHLVGDACKAMLTDAVKAANLCRIFSLGATWNNRSHEELFSAYLRGKHLSVYGLIFLMVVEINRASAAKQNYKHKIDYVLDDGNRFKKHVNQYKSAIKGAATLAANLVGEVDFKTDSSVLGLQAADLISWATRRKYSGKGLNGVHEPLEGLFDQFYVHSPAPPKLIKLMSKRFEVAECNIDPDRWIGRLLVRRWEIYWTGIPFGLTLVTVSLLGILDLWRLGVGMAGTTFALHAAGVWWMKRSFRKQFTGRERKAHAKTP